MNKISGALETSLQPIESSCLFFFTLVLRLSIITPAWKQFLWLWPLRMHPNGG
jgi:hypothetical protein